MTTHQERLAMAEEVLDILGQGHYDYEGQRVELPDLTVLAESTVVFGPADESRLLEVLASRRNSFQTAVTVTDEDTFTAARRVQAEYGRVVALNFANATTPGGGFLRGARAQEEDLCRCSALYHSLTSEAAESYYFENEQEFSFLFTDHLIYSPDVPVFRDRTQGFLPAPVPVSVITAPAPYVCGLQEDHEEGMLAQVPEVLKHRAHLILAVAADHKMEHLILGAWGCGAFCNDPKLVASIFKDLLQDEAKGAFQSVVFAVYDPHPDQPNLRTFQMVLGRGETKVG